MNGTRLAAAQEAIAAAHLDAGRPSYRAAGASGRDVEWAVQLVQLRHAYALPGLRKTRTLEALPAELEAKQLHVTYFSAPVDAARFAQIDREAYLPEEFRLGDRELYLYAPDGLGRSKLAEHLAKPRINKGLIATTRNWNTVVKLVELTAG